MTPSWHNIYHFISVGGLQFAATDNLNTSGLIDSFTGLVSENGDSSQQTIQVWLPFRKAQPKLPSCRNYCNRLDSSTAHISRLLCLHFCNSWSFWLPSQLLLESLTYSMTVIATCPSNPKLTYLQQTPWPKLITCQDWNKESWRRQHLRILVLCWDFII